MIGQPTQAASPDLDDGRFSFGENWLAFIEHLDESRIIEAEQSVQALCGAQRLDGKRFLDIGSGSGLFSLAARRLGANVFSFDYDRQSVAATSGLKDRFFPDDPNWTVAQGSVLDPNYLAELGTFDIVYSWGVLHHTGAMYDAIKNAATRVGKDGLFAFALYRKTTFCGFWTHEKRWYSTAAPAVQKLARGVYASLMRLAFLVKRRDFSAYVRDYRNNRGMSYWHDVHDWMGGYPYESISPPEVEKLLSGLGFAQVRSNTRPHSLGIFGSGCDEYAYRKL